MENDDGCARTYDCQTKPQNGVDESLNRTAATEDPTRVAEVNGSSDTRILRMLGGDRLDTQPQMTEQKPDRTQQDGIAPTTHLAANRTLPGRTRRPRKRKSPPQKKKKKKGAKRSKPCTGKHALAGCKRTRACISSARDTQRRTLKNSEKKTGRKNLSPTM